MRAEAILSTRTCTRRLTTGTCTALIWTSRRRKKNNFHNRQTKMAKNTPIYSRGEMPGSQAQSTGRADREAATKHWNRCVIGAQENTARTEGHFRDQPNAQTKRETRCCNLTDIRVRGAKKIQPVRWNTLRANSVRKQSEK